MNNKIGGEFLASKRNELGLSVTQIAESVGCHRTTIQRLEKGIGRFRRSMVVRVAQAYGVEADELAEFCGYPAGSIAKETESEVTASVEDLEFLITVTRSLQRPMTVTIIRELLKCRQAKK